jgi:signal transduction histidine kinase
MTMPTVPTSSLTRARPGQSWSLLQRIVALCFVAATLPLGIGVGILLAPVERSPLVMLASLLSVAAVVLTGLWLWRRHQPAVRPADADTVLALLNGLSHELRTPLNSIIGFSDLVLSETEHTLSTRHRQYLNDVLGSGQQLLAVVNELLDLAKVATGGRRLRPEALVPADVVAGAFEALAGEAALRDVNLVARDHATQEAWADRASLGKVLVHLVESALRFSPAGATVEVETRDASGAVSFCIRDQGPARSQALTPGPSLGVLISERLIEEHGGRLALEAAPNGRGSTFRFRIPATPGPRPRTPAPFAARSPGAAS